MRVPEKLNRVHNALVALSMAGLAMAIGCTDKSESPGTSAPQTESRPRWLRTVKEELAAGADISDLAADLTVRRFELLVQDEQGSAAELLELDRAQQHLYEASEEKKR